MFFVVIYKGSDRQINTFFCKENAIEYAKEFIDNPDYKVWIYDGLLVNIEEK